MEELRAFANRTTMMLIYEPSPKHCEPISAEKPGLKCPAWSVALAQELLDESEIWGQKRVATRDGIAFVAHKTYPDRDVWHGYPEAWDKIDYVFKKKWKKEGKVKSKDLRHFKTRARLRDHFGGGLPK